MKVTYLGHSGFLLEWERCYWIFDYYTGKTPTLNPQKEILVFCSHSHGDHFNPEIFKLLSDHPSTTYIFSNEIRNACKKLQKRRGMLLPDIQYIKSRTILPLTTPSGEVLDIFALQSTDCGCAFLIKYDDRLIYHAGDLHWWYWDGESTDWNKKMTADYKKEIEYLDGKIIDLAFTVLDPRQEKDYALGMNYFLEHTHTKNMFPMHFWDNFQITEKYIQENTVTKETRFHTIQQNGQAFEIMI